MTAYQLPNPAEGISWDEAQRMKLWIVDRLQSSLEPNIKLERSTETVQIIYERFRLLCQHINLRLSEEQEKQLFGEILDELLGFGPIEPLLADDTITEIMINGPHQVYVERNGKLIETDVRFLNDEHVLRVINKIIEPLGRRIDRTWPMVDARLPDGSRVNAIIPPCAIDGPVVTIRKFSRTPFTVQDLINFGTLTEQMAEFLRACVVSRLNIVVSGGTGSGKTTLLNVLSSFIPEEERIVTIEDSAELQLHQRHVVRLESKPPEPDGSGRVTIRDLVINALRMRPERIVVGECRGGEALDMLQAMNTGHDGSMTTIHANSPRDALSRLETLVLMSGMDLPLFVVRQQIASAIDLIVQQARLRDGSRKIVNITEVQGMEGETIVLQDVFRFEEEGEEDGRVIGRMRPMGVRPRFEPRLKARGFKLPPSMFTDTARSKSGRR